MAFATNLGLRSGLKKTHTFFDTSQFILRNVLRQPSSSIGKVGKIKTLQRAATLHTEKQKNMSP
jgi:hypothetical protein